MDFIVHLSSVLIAVALSTSSADLARFRDPSGAWQLNRALSEAPAYEEIGFVGPRELVLPVNRLVLTLTATSVTFYDADGARRRYALSGEKQRGDWRGGLKVETRARWNGQTLRVEVKPQRGLDVIENYTIDPNTRQLILSVVPVRRGFHSARIRYVYDTLLQE